MDIKQTLKSPLSNPVGALVGAAALYFAAKKFMKVEKKWMLISLALVGGVAGALAQSKWKSKAMLASTAKTSAIKA